MYNCQGNCVNVLIENISPKKMMDESGVINDTVPVVSTGASADVIVPSGNSSFWNVEFNASGGILSSSDNFSWLGNDSDGDAVFTTTIGEDENSFSWEQLTNTVWLALFSIVFTVSILGNGMVLILILSKWKFIF